MCFQIVLNKQILLITMANINGITTDAPKGGITYGSINIRDDIDYEIKLKPLYTGLCGTDRAEVSGSLSFTYNPVSYNYMVLGHEAVCEVIDAKENEFEIKAGDYVVPIVRRPGKCVNCRIGRQDNCSDGDHDIHETGIRGIHGFNREYLFDDAKNLVKINDKNMVMTAAMTEPTKNVMKAFEVFNRVSKRAIFENEDSTYLEKNCVIIGTGSEAFLYAFMAREYRMNGYLVNRHDITDYKKGILDKINANFYDYTREDKVKKIDLLIDTSGDPATIIRFLRKLNYNGVLILFGTNGKAPEAGMSGEDIDYIIERNITLAGSVDGSKIHYLKAVEYLEKWNYSEGSVIKNLITGEYKPDDTSIFLKKPAEEIKSLIKWF